MKLLVLSAFLVTLVGVSVGQPVGTFVCSNPDGTVPLTLTDGNEVLTFTAPNSFDDTVNPVQTFVRVFVAGSNDFTAGCFETITGAANEFTTLSVPITGNPCGITLVDNTDGTNDGTTSDINIKIILAQDANRIQSDDFTFNIQCDFLAPTTNDVSVDGITVSNDPQAGTPQVAQEALTFSVVQASDDSILTQCTLGAEIKLQTVLEKSTTARGAAVVSCRAGSTVALIDAADAQKSADFITDYCANTGFGSGLPANTGFGIDIVNGLDTEGNSFTTRTGVFKCFKFSESDQLAFKCTVSFCSSDAVIGTPTFCTADNCLAARRKRRDVSSKNSTVEDITVVINVGTAPNQQSNNKSHTEEICTGYMHNHVFIAVVVVLAGLLLVSMCITVFVAKRSRNVDAPPAYPMNGKDNPAF